MTTSPIHDTEKTLFEPSIDPQEPHVESVFASESNTHSEPLTFQRQETPSPIRESFVQENHTTDDFHVSSARPNEASQSPGIHADEAEDLVTLTTLYALLSRYVEQVGDLEKDLKDTKATLGGR